MSSAETAKDSAQAWSAEEWKARRDLAACYRLIDHFGWTDLIYNHITARVSGEGHHILINPFGLHYEEVCASNLVKIDLDGNKVEPSDYGINKAGYVIHSAVHAARSDVRCVVHTHSRFGVAVSCLEEGFLPMTQGGLQFYNRIAYHDYEGIALDLDERSRLVADLGDNNAMILRNHGLLTCGRSVAEAFSRMFYLEQACQVQIDALSAGRKLNELSGQVSEHTARQWDGGGDTPDEDEDKTEWAALLRLLDRRDPSYRE